MNSTRTSAKDAPLSPYAWAVSPHIRLVWAAVTLACVAAFLELAPFWIAWRMARTILEPAPGQIPVPWLAVLGLGLVVLRVLAQGGSVILGHVAAFRAECRLRQRLLDHVAALPLGWLEGRAGDIKRTVMEDVGRLNGLLAHTLPDMISGMVLPLAALGFLASLDWRMALASAATLPLAVVAQMRMAAASRGTFARWVESEARANGALLSYVRGIGTLRAFGRQASSLGQVRDLVHSVRDLAQFITRRAALPYAVFGTSMAFPLAVLLPLGLFLTARGELALTDFLAFLALGGMVLLPLGRVVMALHGLRNLTASGERVADLLRREPLPHLAATTPPADTTIRFDGVHYAVPLADGTALPVLRHICLVIPEGRVTVLCGPSGAGKSTIARLLARLDDPTSGRITIGGTDIRAMAPQDLRGLVAVVFQDPVLFHASLRDNVRLARPEASDDDVIAALQAAGAGSLLESLPGGLDALVGDRGSRLSGGECQRIALARAFLKNAPILILDEATAHVDPVAEREIRQAMDTLMQGRTVLMVAHRLRGLETAGQIVVMKDGRVEAAAPHHRLLEISATYADLWAAQAEAATWSLGESAA